jgi:hypothetical protein
MDETEASKELKERKIYINVMPAKPAPIILSEPNHHAHSQGWGWGGILIFFFVFLIIMLLLGAGCWNWNRCSP